MSNKSSITAARVASLFVAVTLVGTALAGGAQAQMSSPGELHEALRLTPAQEPAWKAYQDAIAPDPTAKARHQAAQMLMPNLETPRRVDLIDAQMQADLDAVHRAGEAVKAFYAALTPAQQHVFDAQTAPRPAPADGPPPPPR